MHHHNTEAAAVTRGPPSCRLQVTLHRAQSQGENKANSGSPLTFKTQTSARSSAVDAVEAQFSVWGSRKQHDVVRNGAHPLAGSPDGHPSLLLLHPLSLQSPGHARAPDLRRQLEVPHLHRLGDPGGVLRPVRPHRHLQPADQRRGQSGAGEAAPEAHRTPGLDHGGAGVSRGSVCGVYVLVPVPVRQRAGLPQTPGQLHPTVAQPRHAHHSSAVHHYRDADHSSQISQQAMGSGCCLHLRSGIHPLDVLGAPCDRRVGVPRPGEDLSSGSGGLLQRPLGSHRSLLRFRRDLKQLHLGPAQQQQHRKSERRVTFFAPSADVCL